ncbi:MAG: ABC transporter ATP-binding protein [Lachnoclostridium sp.]|nr:ABC transporter ATP-binding protein [Lachnoclostridium sp.]
MSETILIKDLTTGYPDKGDSRVITSGITTTLESGTMTCLLGPNGAGKSTLLKTISCSLDPLEGTFRILGRDRSDYTRAELAKVVGVVLTEQVHFVNLTVEELVGLGRSPYTGFFGQLSDNDRRIVSEAILTVGIPHLKDRPITSLSDGERQKAMIAKVLAQQTPIILLDEPSAFLDFPSKVELMLMLRCLCREKNKTVLLSTHDLDIALQMADNLWLISKDDGLISGMPEDLSLQGWLPRIFSGKDIIYNEDTGLFGIDFHPQKSITISGDGTRVAMLRKALLRAGFLASAATDGTPGDIRVSADGFEYQSVFYPTIASLLHKICEID